MEMARRILRAAGLAIAILSPALAMAQGQPVTPPPYEQHRGQNPVDPSSHPVRGGYVPQALLGAVVTDPARYRVRPAPPGYRWIHVGHDLFLVQDRSGLVVDLVENGYN